MDLLNACQHDLWRVSDSRGFRVGEFGQTKLENSKVLMIVSDHKLLEQILGSKSETVHMMITTPEFMIRQKVPIDYKK